MGHWTHSAIRRNVGSSPTEELNIRDWARRTVSLYPTVDQIWLCGSRAGGWARPTSDYDLLVVLTPDSYDADGVQRNQIEQRIAFDPSLRDERIDLFFRRPGGGLGRWDWGPDDPCPRSGCDDFDDYVAGGVPPGDFSRFEEDLRYAVGLFNRATNCVPDGE